MTAAIVIQEVPVLGSINPSSGTASGGTGFSLTGTGLSGATSVTFGGVAATSVNVVNSTTVTGVTPAHAIGAVDITITTSTGSSTLTNGYTYNTTALGQLSGGGQIACLGGGLNNLIAAAADYSTVLNWGGQGTTTNATSTSDGALNTATIVACLTGPGGAGGCPMNIPANTYAAGACKTYQVDSQGHTPCQAGNTCYNDWFLPAGNSGAGGQLGCLFSAYSQGKLTGVTGAYHWSSTEFSSLGAESQLFNDGSWMAFAKNGGGTSFLCVRVFTP